ncbi:MAG TPA: hypothetical protein DCY40_05950 [Actinobacteria bacterium]|nr:hypothetical protein [Actinomycetota bacterium]
MTSDTTTQQHDGAGEAPENTPAKPVYFDALRHERVQKQKNRGIKVDLGPLWNNLVMVMRPFSHPAVVAAQEAAEKQIRINLGMKADDKKDLPTLDQIEANKVAVRKAIVGCDSGAILALPEQIAVAKKFGFEVQTTADGEVVVFTGREDEEAVREFFRPLIRESHDFFGRLIAASQQIREIKDEEIDPLGDRFVLGQHVALASVA